MTTLRQRAAAAAVAVAIVGVTLAASAVSRALQPRETDFTAMVRQQAETDERWKAASAGRMRMDKITYRSQADDLEIPAFVFQPLRSRGVKGHPALVWVHENVGGHLYEHYIPFVREAVARGFIVIAPEYRGSIGYGPALYDAIDYGGTEVDDVTTAVDVLKRKYPQVDPARVGIIGWSHGGMIAILAVTRNPGTFKAAVSIAPVTNLFQRLAWKGVEQQHDLIDPANRIGGLPAERHRAYTERSPVYQIDKLQTPLLVHVARNDEDVEIEESMQLIDALRARKPDLSETKVYDHPPGGHLFDRQVDPETLEPESTGDLRDSWSRVWRFLDWHLNHVRGYN